MVTLTSGFDFHAQWGFLLVFYSNPSPKCAVSYKGHATDRQTDGRIVPLLNSLYQDGGRKNIQNLDAKL